MVAAHMKLDAGALESLNSMIKSSMATANNSNTSLELLSSRVNSRKTISMETAGKTRLQDVRPIAERLARTSVLYQGREEEVLRADMRWAPPGPKAILPNEPQKYAPALLMSAAERACVSKQTKLLKALREHRDAGPVGSCNLFGVGFWPRAHDGCAPTVYLLGELSGRSCALSLLQRSTVDNQEIYSLSAELPFVSGIKAIASARTAARQAMCTLSFARTSPVQAQALAALELKIVKSTEVLVLRSGRDAQLHLAGVVAALVVLLTVGFPWPKERSPKPNIFVLAVVRVDV